MILAYELFSTRSRARSRAPRAGRPGLCALCLTARAPAHGGRAREWLMHPCRSNDVVTGYLGRPEACTLPTRLIAAARRVRWRLGGGGRSRIARGAGRACPNGMTGPMTG